MSDWLIRFDHELINLATGVEITCYLSDSDYHPEQWELSQQVGNLTRILEIGGEEVLRTFRGLVIHFNALTTEQFQEVLRCHEEDVQMEREYIESVRRDG